MNQNKIEEIRKTISAFTEAYPITFDGRRHKYRLEGKACAGVSSISDYRPIPWLKFWSAKMVIEFLSDKLPIVRGKDYTEKEWQELLAEAKKQHTQRSKNALDIGTKVHDWIEQHIKGKDLKITAEIKNPIQEFLKFEKEHKVAWILSEQIVSSFQHKVAGRVDSLAEVNGKITVVDLKTSSHIDEGYFLQTAGYQMCLEEMGVKVEQRIILRLPKTEGDKFEAVLVETDYEMDKKAFLNLRYAWQWANYVDSQFKEEVIVNGYKQKQLRLKKI